jgi:hypothetical protein
MESGPISEPDDEAQKGTVKTVEMTICGISTAVVGSSGWRCVTGNAITRPHQSINRGVGLDGGLSVPMWLFSLFSGGSDVGVG